MIENWMTMSPEEQERALALLKTLKAEYPEGFAGLNPKFKVVTDEEVDQDQAHIKKVKDTKSK